MDVFFAFGVNKSSDIFGQMICIFSQMKFVPFLCPYGIQYDCVIRVRGELSKFFPLPISQIRRLILAKRTVHSSFIDFAAAALLWLSLACRNKLSSAPLTLFGSTKPGLTPSSFSVCHALSSVWWTFPRLVQFGVSEWQCSLWKWFPKF